MKELIAVEAALFSAGRPLDPTETAEATGLSRNKALGALDALVVCLEEFDPSVKEAAAWALSYISKYKE